MFFLNEIKIRIFQIIWKIKNWGKWGKMELWDMEKGKELTKTTGREKKYFQSFATRAKNSYKTILGCQPKSYVKFQFFLQIDIARLITDLYQEEKVLGNFGCIKMEF